MERALLLTIEDWQNWYHNKVSAWGSDRSVVSYADTETPNEYPCLLVAFESLDECGYGFTCYDFIYRKDVDQIFQPIISPTNFV